MLDYMGRTVGEEVPSREAGIRYTEELLHEGAGAAAIGIIIGMAMGGYKGATDSAHLRSKFGTYANLQNKPYKIPMNIVHASNKAASWGWKFGFLFGTFAGSRYAIDKLLPREAKKLQESGDVIAKSVGDLLASPIGSKAVPTAGAGTLIGTIYGGMAGGLRGTLLGFGTGLAASTAAGVFFAGCDICSQYLEDEIEKQKMSNAQLTGVARQAQGEEFEADKPGEWAESRGDLRMMLDIMRKREKEEKVDLSGEKAEVKRMLKALQ